MSGRLTSNEISVLCSLITRGAQARAVSLEAWRRETASPLWRRGLVGIWYRQFPNEEPALQGPYFGLTIAGAHLATALMPAPRGTTGAERGK